MYVTGATKGSAIPYPGGISAPDIENFITVVEAKTASAQVARLLKIATTNAARKAKGASSGTNDCPELQAKLAKAKDYDAAEDIIFGEPGIDCCAKSMPRALCEAAYGDAAQTMGAVSAIPVVGQIYDATMGHLFSIAQNKRKASQVNAKMGMATLVNKYLNDLEAWFELRALIELGYPDLAAFLHDCRGVVSKGKYRTRKDLRPATHIVTPYMTWHGSDEARWHFGEWKKRLEWTNRPQAGSAGGARIFRGPSFPEGPGGASLSHRHDLQRWLLNRFYSGTEVADKDCAHYPQDPTRGNRSRRCVVDYRDAADPMGPNCLTTAGWWTPVAHLFFKSMSDHPDRLGGFLGIQSTLWKEGGKYRNLINRLKQNRTIKEICKEGMGSARYHSGGWYSAGSVRRSGLDADGCAGQLAIRIARIQLLADYQGRGGVPDVAGGRRWINKRYEKELAFLRRLKMSETQKAGAYKVKKSTSKSTSTPSVVKYDALTGKRAEGTGPSPGVVVGLVALAGAGYWLWKRKK